MILKSLHDLKKNCLTKTRQLQICQGYTLYIMNINFRSKSNCWQLYCFTFRYIW